MLPAAFASRSSISPPCGQTGVRTDGVVLTRSPQPEHAWLV
jgi:hypothetical protein